MELTIKIADAEYKELSVTQKRGLAELLQLDGAKGQDEAEEVDTIRENNQNDLIIGDGHLIGSEDRWPDITENFLALKQEWSLCENAHLVVPEYLKSASSYMPQGK